MLDMAIDPGKLAEQLDAAREARDHLDRVIGWLEDGVAIFAGAPAAADLEQPADEADGEDSAIAGGGVSGRGTCTTAGARGTSATCAGRADPTFSTGPARARR